MNFQAVFGSKTRMARANGHECHRLHAHFVPLSPRLSKQEPGVAFWLESGCLLGLSTFLAAGSRTYLCRQ